MYLDERFVQYYHRDVKGNIEARRCSNVQAAEPTQRLSLKEMRACVTHVAIICTAAEAQRRLPHYFRGHTNIMLVRDVRAVQVEVPQNVIFLRGKSAWTSVDFMVLLISEVATVCRELRPQREVIVSLDCARQHLRRRVALAAGRHGLFLVYLPAKLTWLLQPCDTHVFVAYKHKLREEYAAERCRSPAERVSSRAWMAAIATAIVAVVQNRDWTDAFARTGWTDFQNGFSTFVSDAC
jgi:hypothetical protein